jgi:stage II sporulation protein D
MEKGHFIWGITVFLLMMILPAVGVVGANPTAEPPVFSGEQGKEEVLRLYRTDTDKVEVYPVKEYLFGVVAAEMPMSYPKEAVKAQVVAAYTLTLHRMSHRSMTDEVTEKGADMTDDSGTDQGFISREVALQKWGDKAEEYQNLLDGCIDEVYGKRVTYQEETALTVYHSISSGRTESAKNVWGSEIPYLTAVESVGDLISDGYISEKTLTKGEFLQGLATLDTDLSDSLSAEEAIGEVARSQSGTVLKINILGKEFTGQEIRKAFSLRSANFDVAVSGDNVVFTVRGYGHLVGMSQFGAKTMAQQGSTYEEILTWYYKGCQVV